VPGGIPVQPWHYGPGNRPWRDFLHPNKGETLRSGVPDALGVLASLPLGW